MNDPRKSHLTAAKRVLRYVKGTMKFDLLFQTENNGEKVELIGYSDSDWCEDRSDRRSTSGYVFKFNNVAISWCTKKHPTTVSSSCEVEYIAGTFAACQAIWLDTVMKELNCEVENPLKLKFNNK
ncbi:putative RNA-directed DNA polymerase [Medicago truncatula]|uniref:Putative RNA-directed DNA polymerase n=1 Tax=Medicago truncatula TaxID=3880 RepID=A0A396GIT0_MEDTR|nr:putative RNA-directed DNA polymerase [Medicago truncatula]